MPAPAVYLNRFTPSKRWHELRFRTGRTLQGSELNEMQSILRDRSDRLGRGVYKDGHVIENARLVSIVPTAVDGSTHKAEAGRITLRGTAVDMDEAFLAIPLDKYVIVGIRYRQVEITEADDVTLLNQATGTRGYLEPGASRIREDFAWGWTTDGADDPLVGWDSFYPVYEVRNGNVVTRDIPPVQDPVVAIIAKYDRESHGNYVVDGFSARYVDVVGGNYRYDVEAGAANLQGYKVERASSTLLFQTNQNTTVAVIGEPHSYSGGDQQTIYLNKSPLAILTRVLATKTKTIRLTKGAANGMDELPDTTVYNVLSIKSADGATTYAATTSWLLAGNKVNWSPGGPEPAVGASYDITYTYQTQVQPVASGHDYITLSNITPGTEVFVDYSYSLPRKDVIVLTKSGTLVIFEGESQARKPVEPVVSDDQIAIATIEHDWVHAPVVRNIAIRAIPFNEIQLMREQIYKLFELSATIQLRNEGNLLIEGEKLGVFVDSFADDSLRDAANPQTAAIVAHTLMLPVAGDAYPPSNTADLAKYQTLPFELEPIVVQNQKTGCMFINPYQYVEPPPEPVIPTTPVDPPHPVDPPVVVVVNPPIDPWVDPGTPPTTGPVIPNIIVPEPIDPGEEEDEGGVIQMRYTPPGGGQFFAHNYNRSNLYARLGKVVKLNIKGGRPGQTYEILDWR